LYIMSVTVTPAEKLYRLNRRSRSLLRFAHKIV
jgi:hypothetical protein